MCHVLSSPIEANNRHFSIHVPRVKKLSELLLHRYDNNRPKNYTVGRYVQTCTLQCKLYFIAQKMTLLCPHFVVHSYSSSTGQLAPPTPLTLPTHRSTPKNQYPPDLQTARKDIALGVLQKKYKRLEADMFRSRVELADTFVEVEKGRQLYSGEMACAEERRKELEAALRAADEVP